MGPPTILSRGESVQIKMAQRAEASVCYYRISPYLKGITRSSKKHMEQQAKRLKFLNRTVVEMTSP